MVPKNLQCLTFTPPYTVCVKAKAVKPSEYLRAVICKHCFFSWWQASQNTGASVTEKKNVEQDYTEFGIVPAALGDKMIFALSFSTDRLNIFWSKSLHTENYVKNWLWANKLSFTISQAFVHSQEKFHVNWNNILKNQPSAATTWQFSIPLHLVYCCHPECQVLQVQERTVPLQS